MTSRKKLAAAIALMLGATTNPLMAAVCMPNSATPFVGSAIDTYAPPTLLGHGFPKSLTDSEGVALQICTDLGLCFFDPPVAGNAYSASNGFGAEGFWYLAESAFASANIDVLVVMAAEAAFTTENPNPAETFPFTRLRVRITVPEPGLYTVIHPYGSKTYEVLSVVDARGRPTNRQINDTADISLAGAPNGLTNTGNVVGPWLRWTRSGEPGFIAGETAAPPAGYLGDGATTPHTVIGSPCDQNFVKVIAKRANGTSITIDAANSDGDGDVSTLSNRLFTVQGKIAPNEALTPLVADSVYYSRQGDAVDVHTFTTAPTTATVTASAAGVAETLVRRGSNFYATLGSVATDGTVPASIVLNATNVVDGSAVSAPRIVTVAPVPDLVTVTKADATCTGIDTARVCSLVVNAESSDNGAVKPTLTVTIGGTPVSLNDGIATITGLSALPSRITVNSSATGTASKPVTIINQ
jgi:hypothetical protein